jgi:hypothetical protein
LPCLPFVMETASDVRFSDLVFTIDLVESLKSLVLHALHSTSILSRIMCESELKGRQEQTVPCHAYIETHVTEGMTAM